MEPKVRLYPTRWARIKLVASLRAAAPVDTGALRASIRRFSYGARIGVAYASYTDSGSKAGANAGWIGRAIRAARSFGVTIRRE